MTLKEAFVKGYILNTDHCAVIQINDLIYQQHGKAVGQGPLYTWQIKDRLFVRIIYRHIFDMLVLFDILLDLTGKLHIGGMSRTVGYDMCLNRVTYQRQVSNNVQQFMAGRFIRETQLDIIEN